MPSNLSFLADGPTPGTQPLRPVGSSADTSALTFELNSQQTRLHRRHPCPSARGLPLRAACYAGRIRRETSSGAFVAAAPGPPAASDLPPRELPRVRGSQLVCQHRYLISTNSSMPCREPSRPSPLCLTPPKGAASLEIAPQLIPTMPVSSRSATRHRRDAFSL